ncbi:MAG TPA: DUF2798 domain-containing protein [Nitrososphaera sp.]|nr:DUF2798 domain-containing protein [Nitrososphaera sp.]
MTKKLSRKYSRLLLVAIMAPSMAFFMTLLETLVRLGLLAPNFLAIWMSSFAIGLAVIFPLALILSRIAGEVVDKVTIKEEI